MSIKKRGFLWLVISLVFFLAISFYWSFSDSSFSIASQGFVRNTISPVGKMFSSFGSSIHNLLANLQSYPSLVENNQRLLIENESLKNEIKIRDQIQFDNERFSMLLGIVQDNPNTYIPASIIYRTPDSTMNFIINRGSNSNVKDGLAVVSPVYKNSSLSHFQLLGKTIDVSKLDSPVLSLYDENSNVSIRNLRNNVNGTVSFNSKNNTLYVKFYKKEDYQLNDILVVSSFSSLPNDLLVGSIVEIQPTESIHYLAIVKPVKDFSKITEVLVIQ